MSDTLKQLGIDDNTLVIDASDNGRGPGLSLQQGSDSATVVRAMDWYPPVATFAGIRVPEERVIDGRSIRPLLTGESQRVPPPALDQSLNATVPLRRHRDPPGERQPVRRRLEAPRDLYLL